jgi:hypothetical protein
MNSDVQNRLIAAARNATFALEGQRTPIERLIAKNALEDALAEILLDADFRKHSDPAFDGEVYDPAQDDKRLRNQLGKIFECMMDGRWRTLQEIELETKQPPASISAQLRHLRKPRFGSYVVEKRPRGERETGLFEYRLLAADGQEIRIERKAPR